MTQKVLEARDAIVSIVEKLANEPARAKTSRAFLVYSLDSMLKILTKYDELEEHHGISNEIRVSLASAKNALESLVEGVKKHHARLLEGDVMDLDTEIRLLKQTIRTEGYE